MQYNDIYLFIYLLILIIKIKILNKKKKCFLDNQIVKIIYILVIKTTIFENIFLLLNWSIGGITKLNFKLMRFIVFEM
jgi:hypothetical protein